MYISGGGGDAKRPDAFAGSFQVATNGILVPIQVVSIGGVFRARLALGGAYERVDPQKYGFSDPGKLIDPNVGLSSLLSHAKTAAMNDRDRLSGEELYEISITLPGDLVKNLLTSADPATDVRGTVGIDVDDHQVRRVVLTGPFFARGRDSTYTVTLTDYAESVTVTPPPGG